MLEEADRKKGLLLNRTDIQSLLQPH